MLSHVTVGTNDMDRSRKFYDAVLATFGAKALHVLPEEGWTGYGNTIEQPWFWVGKPYNGEAATFGNGVTIALNAPSRKVVDAFHAAALANGGSDEGAPGLRPHYHPNCYAAYVRDPEGNKLCSVCHLPE